MPESVLTHTIPLLFAGGVCCEVVVFDDVAVLAGVADADAGVAGALAAGAVDFGVLAGAPPVVAVVGVVDLVAAGVAAPLLAGAVVSVVAVFFDLEDFWVLEPAVSLDPAALLSAVSAFLDFEDFLVVEADVSPVLPAESAVSLLDLLDFFVELPDAELEAAASASLVDFFDFEVDFLLVEAEVSGESVACLDLLVEVFDESALVLSAVVLFFFFFDFAVLLLWSVDWASCGLCAARSVTSPARNISAATTARNTRLRELFMFEGSFRPELFVSPG
jgi:hypothetical protein